MRRKAIHTCFISALAALLFSSYSIAANTPCSGRMGGVDRCVDGRFLCQNGKISRSKKVCDPRQYPSKSTASASQKETVK